MAEDATVSVEDVVERERYEVHLDGERAGLLTYHRDADRTVFLHAEVDDRFEGRGIGSALARAALDAERAAGRRIEPRCPFVAGYLDRHPEYSDLVSDGYRPRPEA